MEEVVRWMNERVTLSSDVHLEVDVVPSEISNKLWRDIADEYRNDPGDTILKLVRTCLSKLEEAANNKHHVLIERARAVLRLSLAVAVRSTSVDEAEVAEITTRLEKQKALPVSSELRFIQSGGNCNHAAIFPFATGPAPGCLKTGWRRKLKSTKRRRLDDAPFLGIENVFSKDVIVHVLRFCGVKTIGRACQVSREWNFAEKSAQDAIWKGLFVRKWPNVKGDMTDCKDRYATRISSIRKMKLPVGRRTVPVPHYCPWCDVPFPTASACKKHSCKQKKVAMMKEKLAADPVFDA